MKSHFEEMGDSASIVTPGRFCKHLGELGLESQRDYVAATQLVETAELFKDKTCQAVLHHSAASMAEFDRFFSPLFEALGQVPTISLYADGYTNRYLDREQVDTHLKNNRHVLLAGMVFFDVRGDADERFAGRGVASIRIPSRHVAAYAETPLARAVAAAEFEHMRKTASNRDILLLLLRPIGSKTFHRGAFSLEDGVAQAVELYDVLLREVASAVGRPLSVFVRPDDRDPDFSHSLIEAIRDRVTGMTVEPCGSHWPDWMTYEPVLFLAQRELAPARVHLAAVDSTAPFPLMQTRTIDSHFLGLPLDDTPTGLVGQPGLEFFYRKVRFMRGQVDQLDLLDMNISEIRAGLYRVFNA